MLAADAGVRLDRGGSLCREPFDAVVSIAVWSAMIREVSHTGSKVGLWAVVILTSSEAPYKDALGDGGVVVGWCLLDDKGEKGRQGRGGSGVPKFWYCCVPEEPPVS